MKTIRLIIIALLLSISMANTSSASNTIVAGVAGAAIGYAVGSNAGGQQNQQIDINQDNKFIAEMCLSAYSETRDQRSCVDNGMFYWQTTHNADLTKKEIKKYIVDQKAAANKLFVILYILIAFIFLYMVFNKMIFW